MDKYDYWMGNKGLCNHQQLGIEIYSNLGLVPIMIFYSRLFVIRLIHSKLLPRIIHCSKMVKRIAYLVRFSAS